jgi:hypothetical protein
MKYLKTFENHEEESLEKCKWCDKDFLPRKNELCCCKECDSKYNNYLANDNSESPSDYYGNDIKNKSYW